MSLQVKSIISFLDDLAPPSTALPGDPVGLQLGSPEAHVKKIIVALDPDQGAVDEASAVGADMLVTHHPLFYRKLSSINESTTYGALIAAAIRKGLTIYSLHTNFDVAPKGVTYQLAKTLNLPVEGAEVLEVTAGQQLLKMVVFIPAGHEDKIRNALSEVGAGHIGSYSHCTFQVAGMGTFMPGEGTKPYIGSSGQLEKVDEIRLETILPTAFRAAALEALSKVHPYEEAAYDFYPLDLDGKEIGLGLVINLEKPVTLDYLLALCRNKLGADSLRYFNSGSISFKRIALCGGSGGSIISHAARKEADVLISGDFSYHDLKEAESLGIALIDAGHHLTEQPGVIYLCKYLEECLKTIDSRVEVCLQARMQSGWSR